MYIYFSVIVILSLNKFLIANAQLDIKKKKKKRFYPGSFAPAQITCTLILLLNIFKNMLIK